MSFIPPPPPSFTVSATYIIICLKYYKFLWSKADIHTDIHIDVDDLADYPIPMLSKQQILLN